ncbi:MAG: hypothetical protein RIS92_940 [Verrucomicrobiota bacterium]
MPSAPMVATWNRLLGEALRVMAGKVAAMEARLVDLRKERREECMTHMEQDACLERGLSGCGKALT